jgi:hypothetical protein
MKRGRKEIGKEFDNESSDEDDHPHPPDCLEKDIWLDVADHPGTKFFRKAIRLVVEKYPNEPYSKSVFTEVKSSINGRDVYAGVPNSRSRRHFPRKATREEFVQAIRQVFEEGQARQKARKMEKQHAEHMTSRRSLSVRDLEQDGLKRNSESDYGLKSCKSEAGLVSRSTIDESQDSDIFFDSPNHPGTLEWRKAVRWAVRQNSSTLSSSSSKRSLKKPLEFSSEIFYAIKQRLKGRRYYYSQQDGDDELPEKVKKKDLIRFFEECFDAEWYMTHSAEPDDVYFEAPLHRATRIWKQTVQSVACDFPDSQYDLAIYRRIQKRLTVQRVNCEVFYIGNPPNSHRWATKREIVENCRDCYNEEKRKRSAAKHPQQERLEIQRGKTTLNHATTSTTRNTITGTASPNDILLPPIKAVPGRGKAATTAACARSKRRLRRKQRYRLTQWPWYQQARQQVIRSTIMVQCSQFWHRLASAPFTIQIHQRYLRVKQSLKTDPHTGRDVFDRLNDRFQLPVPCSSRFCWSLSAWTTTSVPIWAALGIAVILVTFFVNQSVLHTITLQMIPKLKPKLV